MQTPGIDRRQFLLGAGGVAVGSVLLSACGSGAAKSSEPHKAVQPPTHVPFTGVKPDRPGVGGLPPAFYTYPENPPKFVTRDFDDGGTVTMMLEALSIATPEGSNRWWQALNKAVNANIHFQIVPSADYLQKFQVVVAGNTFPEIAQVLQLPNMPQVLERQFADLSEYLSGDAVKEYPGLASIPTEAWQVVTVNGRIWGIPQYRPMSGVICSYRSEVLDQLGVAPDINSGEDFMSFCKEVSSASAKRWAYGGPIAQYVLPWLLEMLEGPNVWKQEGGKFTSWNEVPQMSEALSIVNKMWKNGYLHPDSFANPGELYTWWSGGTTALYFQSFTGWAGYATTNPTWRQGALLPTKWDGGRAPKFLSAGGAAYPDFAAFKKGKPEQIKKLLRICDYLASPFGTQEFLTVNYGVEGHDYTSTNGNLKPTPAAASEQLPLPYVGSQRYTTLYVPNNKADVDRQYEWLQQAMPGGVLNAAQGLYSPTDQTKGATWGKKFKDLQGDIIQGRKPVSAWEDTIKDWKKDVGDKIRHEFETAYAAAH